MEFYTTAKASELLGVSERWLGDKIRENKITAYFVGKSYIILHEDIIEFTKSSPNSRKASEAKP